MGRPAVFLDRDGTLIEERDYLSDPDQVVLIPGAAPAIRDLQDMGFFAILVTNQSGIGRGYFTEEAYHRVHAALAARLADEGVQLDGAYYCPDAPAEPGIRDAGCRKPGPAMYRAAEQELNVDLARSWYVGDKVSDVLPASDLGGTGVLVRTGYGRISEGDPALGCHVVDDVAAAAALIRGLGGAEAHR